MFPYSDFTVREVQFGNGTTGRGLFTTKDVPATVLPYVVIVREEKRGDSHTHCIEAAYVSSQGDTRRIAGLLLDGDPANMKHVEWSHAAIINEPENEYPNCVLHVNPALSKGLILSALGSGEAIIGSFIVTSALEKGSQVLMHYGSAYTRRYETCTPEQLESAEYETLVEESHDALDTFLQEHMREDLVHPA